MSDTGMVEPRKTRGIPPALQAEADKRQAAGAKVYDSPYYGLVAEFPDGITHYWTEDGAYDGFAADVKRRREQNRLPTDSEWKRERAKNEAGGSEQPWHRDLELDSDTLESLWNQARDSKGLWPVMPIDLREAHLQSVLTILIQGLPSLINRIKRLEYHTGCKRADLPTTSELEKERKDFIRWLQHRGSKIARIIHVVQRKGDPKFRLPVSIETYGRIVDIGEKELTLLHADITLNSVLDSKILIDEIAEVTVFNRNGGQAPETFYCTFNVTPPQRDGGDAETGADTP